MNVLTSGEIRAVRWCEPKPPDSPYPFTLFPPHGIEFLTHSYITAAPSTDIRSEGTIRLFVTDPNIWHIGHDQTSGFFVGPLPGFPVHRCTPLFQQCFYHL